MRIILILIFALVTGIQVSAQTQSTVATTEVKAPGEGVIKWMSIQEAEKACREKPKKIIIDVFTDWCGWCKRMDANTFNNPIVSKYISENYYAVKLDAEQKDDILFLGKTFKFIASGRTGYNELAFELLQGKLSYPTIAFMDENLFYIQPLPGYRGPEDMDKILRYFGSDAFRTKTWDEFASTYVSPFPPATQTPAPVPTGGH
jgi:thioredoxin-related protein